MRGNRILLLQGTWILAEMRNLSAGNTYEDTLNKLIERYIIPARAQC
jgi:hypothetical protein